jgi:hypothetical protein
VDPDEAVFICTAPFLVEVSFREVLVLRLTDREEASYLQIPGGDRAAVAHAVNQLQQGMTGQQVGVGSQFAYNLQMHEAQHI